MSGQQPTDCIDAVIACGNSNITLDVNGVGRQELSGSNTCSSQENNSVWLKVTLVTNGTLGFTLRPNSSNINEDYDFFVFGPNVTCGNIGQAIRCSTTNPSAANQGNNLTGMNATSGDIAEGPGQDGDSFVRQLDVRSGETYYIVIDRPIGNSPFSLEWTGSAEFSEPPSDESNTVGVPLNLESCDITMPFDDGLTTFNLSNNDASIIGSQTNVSVTYHATASDANIGINNLPNIYPNNTNPQTIYVRITNDNTGCFELTDFNLTTNLGPDITPPSGFILCDNLNDGNNKNGRVIFDLTSKNNEILNGLSPADFNISYHISKADAEARTPSISDLYYNTIANNQEIFVRIEDAINTNCRSVTPLILIVNPIPEAFNHTILQCDEDGAIDGLTQFNLNQASDDLTGGIPDRSVKFYTDAARTIEISGDSYNNTNNPQTIYLEVINDITSCVNYSELTLQVSITDSNNTSLTICDDDGIEDGFQTFNLTDADSDILNGLPSGLNIAYYQTYNDVLLEQNDLGTSFTNTIPYSQTIYARVENANNCFGISEITLIINELPAINDATDYYCLNTFPNTITLDAGILNDLPSNYNYSWSHGDTTYETQINAIGTYTVTVTNIASGCTKNRTITVDPTSIATFDPLTIPISVTQNNPVTIHILNFEHYQYRLLDSNNVVVVPYQDSNVFENILPGIYTVSVRNIKKDCGSVPNKKVYVIGFPKFFTPNNDGKHDTWQIVGISNMFQANSKVFIFNRFGKLVKELNPLEGWDGFFNGKKLPTDDYWFSIKLQDGRVFKNHFTLKN